jgi:hypothetical protein
MKERRSFPGGKADSASYLRHRGTQQAHKLLFFVASLRHFDDTSQRLKRMQCALGVMKKRKAENGSKSKVSTH